MIISTRLSNFKIRIALVFTLSIIFPFSLSLAQEPPTPLSDNEFENAHKAGNQLVSQWVGSSNFKNWKNRILAFECGRILVAEGDSWLNYPIYTDFTNELEKRNWVVYSSADYGDTLASIVYNRSQLDSIYTDFLNIATLNYSKFSLNESEIEEIKNKCFNLYDGQRNLRPLQFNHLPKGVLLSAGGNDLIIDALNLVLEYKASSAQQIVDQVILDGFLHRVQRMLTEYIFAIRLLCLSSFVDLGDGYGSNQCDDIPVFIHGYDYALASGRGYRIVGLEFTGPWLEPAFAKKGHQEKQINNEVMKMIINRYNVALCHVAKQFAEKGWKKMPFYFLDFRGEVKENWNDEIHPNHSAFKTLAKKLNDIITDFHGLSRDNFDLKYYDSGLPCIRTRSLNS